MLHPRDGLTLLDFTIEDSQEGDAAEERRRVKVCDVSLERVIRVVRGSGNSAENRFEQGLEIVIVRKLAVGRFVP